MFNESKYTRWYYAIIENARCQPDRGTYTEKHHIIPKSMGGSNGKNNLISLTYREHFLCHWLLTKMCFDSTDRRKCYTALSFMKRSPRLHRLTGWQVELIKKQHKLAMVGRTRTPEHCLKLSIAAKKRLSDPAARELLASKKRGTKISSEHAAKLKASHFSSVSDSHREAARKAASKLWTITFTDGSIRKIENLKAFAKEVGCSYQLLHKMYSERTSREKLGIKQVEVREPCR